MVQASGLRDGDDLAEFRSMDRAAFWGILRQPEVGPRAVVVTGVAGSDSAELLLAQHDDVIQALPA